MIGIIIIILIISSIFFSGCINFPYSDNDDGAIREIEWIIPVTPNDVVNANNQFAIDYYSKLRDSDKNILYSPFSISFALAMTYEGARGKTAEEIQSVFHFPKDNNTRKIEYSKIYKETNKDDKEYQLNTANSLWAQQNFHLLEEYVSLIEKYYGGKVTNLDFISDPEGSRKIINGWVENQTHNKIKDLIPSGIIDALTRLVLTNAIYFKGEWVRQFNEKDTAEEDFKNNEGNNVKVQMMRRTDEDAKFNYADYEDLQIIELPYSGNEISMLIILPKEDKLDNLEETFSLENLESWKKDLKEQRVKLYLPKFKLETEYEMMDTFIEMGMEIPFSGGADFSGMTGYQGLFIKYIIHKAFIEVNEEGTEAAAATAVVMSLGVDHTPIFRANHPFMFIIQNRNSGNILFMGRVVDPTE